MFNSTINEFIKNFTDIILNSSWSVVRKRKKILKKFKLKMEIKKKC